MLDRPNLVPLGVALTDLAPGRCRWPVGEDEEGGYLFCGEGVTYSRGHGAAAQSYCAAHAALSRLPRKPSRQTRAIW